MMKRPRANALPLIRESQPSGTAYGKAVMIPETSDAAVGLGWRPRTTVPTVDNLEPLRPLFLRINSPPDYASQHWRSAEGRGDRWWMNWRASSKEETSQSQPSQHNSDSTSSR